jgi:hypothetical protein
VGHGDRKVEMRPFQVVPGEPAQQLEVELGEVVEE